MRHGKNTSAMIRVPVLGEAFAGKPVPVEALPITNWREIRPIKGARLGDCFAAARVAGDSMVDDLISDGDYIIFRLTQEARTGDLVVALTPDGLTLKYLYPQADGTVLLRGANPLYTDQVWSVKQVLIQGVVKRIERDL